MKQYFEINRENGKTIISGDNAKRHFNQVLEFYDKTKEYTHPTEKVDGGLWKENGEWVAFDANSEYTIEEFTNFENAYTYALGETSITKDGIVI